jgi:predicted nucleic acid-binding protein
MSVRVFLDTNILVYAHQREAGERHERAKALVDRVASEGQVPVVSTQVLQEFYNVLRKRDVPHTKARSLVRLYTTWIVMPSHAELVLEGIDAADRWQIHIFDALILAAARKAGCELLYSEDLNTGQSYDGVRVVNPLL